MPTVRARIRQGETVRRHSNKYGPGITPRYLTSGEVGDIEFDTSLFTESQATEWLTSHDYSHYTLSAGEDNDQPTDENKHHRFLAIELTPTSDIQDMDGGLLVPGVKLLAPGTWTDSTQKTPCRYTSDVLQRFAGNWTDMSYWSRHIGGTPRDITDRIADIRNIRYQDGVIADLFFHGATTKSQDSISLLKAASAGKVPWPYSSVEMMTRDKWIISEKLYEAQEVLFDGAAMVNQGACRVCKIRNNEWIQVDPQDEAIQRKEAEPPAPELEIIKDDTMDNKELEAKVETLTKELADLKKAPEPVKAEIPKELTESISTVTATVADALKRLEKLEKAPADPKTSGTSDSRELAAPEYYVPVDRKAGTVGE
jgi:hypothetical protein